MKELLIPLIKDIWEKYGPFAALLVMFVIFHASYTHRLWKGRLMDKDKEIGRLVEERNRLQETVIQKRISTQKDQSK